MRGVGSLVATHLLWGFIMKTVFEVQIPVLSKCEMVNGQPVSTISLPMVAVDHSDIQNLADHIENVFGLSKRNLDIVMCKIQSLAVEQELVRLVRSSNADAYYDDDDA